MTQGGLKPAAGRVRSQKKNEKKRNPVAPRTYHVEQVVACGARWWCRRRRGGVKAGEMKTTKVRITNSGCDNPMYVYWWSVIALMW